LEFQAQLGHGRAPNKRPPERRLSVALMGPLGRWRMQNGGRLKVGTAAAPDDRSPPNHQS
jgi:hypothetical protein